MLWYLPHNCILSSTFYIIYSCYFIHCTFVISFLFAFSSFQFYTFWHELYYIFFTCLLKRNSCPWFLWVCTLLPLYSLQSIYVTTASSIIYPLSSKSISSGGIFCLSQYFYIFSYMGYTGLLFCCTFCSLAIYTTSFSLFFFLLNLIFEYSYL